MMSECTERNSLPLSLSVLFLFLSRLLMSQRKTIRFRSFSEKANEQYFLRQEKENISAVPHSFQLNIGVSFISLLLLLRIRCKENERKSISNCAQRR